MQGYRSSKNSSTQGPFIPWGFQAGLMQSTQGSCSFSGKNFREENWWVLKAALCPATRFQAGHLGPYKKNTRILLHLPDPRDSQEWLMLRAVCCSTGSQLQCLGKSPCAPFPARNDPFRAQLTSSQRSLLERVKKFLQTHLASCSFLQGY